MAYPAPFNLPLSYPFMKNNTPETQFPAHIQEKFEEEIRLELIRQQTEEDLRSNQIYHDFFAQFNAASVDLFIRNYARRKAVYLTRGPQYISQKEQQGIRYKILAEDALWAIQQKKLFNLQCQWRAEQVKLKGIEHSTQFMLLSANIQHCSFISPVSRAEVDLYMSFLRSESGQQNQGFDNWQDYEGFRAEFENKTIPGLEEPSETIPAWYRFYDEHHGTHTLLELEDIRGEKESRYRSLSRQKQLEHIRSKQSSSMQDARPYLSIFDAEIVESFVRQFEDKKTLKYCKAVEQFQQSLDDQMEVDDALETLRNANIPVPVRANADWRNAIIQAAQKYELEQVAQILPAVHQEYTFRAENSINFTQSIVDRKRGEYAYQLCELARQQILEGRTIAGENPDFNF